LNRRADTRRAAGSVTLWVLGSIALAALGVALVLATSDEARKAATAEVVDRMADAAEGFMTQATPVDAHALASNVYQARGISNTHLIDTGDSVVIFDTGLAIQATRQKRALEELVGRKPVSHVILSHSHQDHVGGTQFWAEPETAIIAHREFSEEQRYLKALEPYFHDRNRRLFPWMPEDPIARGPLSFGHVVPTVTIRNGTPYRFTQGGVRFEILPTPGAEGLDNLSLWLPDSKILFVGDTLGPMFPQFPNIFTMRGEKMRKPMEYIESLNQLIALDAELLVPGHLTPIHGAQEIREGLTRIRDAVQYVHDETVRGMNSGKTVWELMEEIQLPPELALSQVHGRVSWGVRSIWEYYATWFHYDSTTELYAVPVREVYADVAGLAGVQALTARARQVLESGEPVKALHFCEIALAAEPEAREALEVQRDALKHLLAQAQAGFETTYEIIWLASEIEMTEAALAAR
jgi:alkyl sulfatase BDS1-like metallo-beta-lactamase superfamily hydrolase